MGPFAQGSPFGKAPLLHHLPIDHEGADCTSYKLRSEHANGPRVKKQQLAAFDYGAYCCVLKIRMVELELENPST